MVEVEETLTKSRKQKTVGRQDGGMKTEEEVKAAMEDGRREEAVSSR